METIDRNAIEELAGSIQKAGIALQKLCISSALGYELPKCATPALDLCLCLGPKVMGPCLCFKGLAQLTEDLKDCGGAFYNLCPKFASLERVWPDFEPAIEAAKWKEKVQLDRIAQLEARVQELELKRKG